MGATGINWQVTRHVRAVGRIRGFTRLVGPVANGEAEPEAFGAEAATVSSSGDRPDAALSPGALAPAVTPESSSPRPDAPGTVARPLASGAATGPPARFPREGRMDLVGFGDDGVWGGAGQR
jgi:hypothetical protein